jgi:hypothetical protein
MLLNTDREQVYTHSFKSTNTKNSGWTHSAQDCNPPESSAPGSLQGAAAGEQRPESGAVVASGSSKIMSGSLGLKEVGTFYTVQQQACGT